MTAVTSRKMKARGGISWAVLGMMFLLPPTLTSAQSADQDITFARDIFPILQENCQNCHRDAGIAPMSLMTYEEVRPWAPLIQYKVVNREMPPWHIDRAIGLQKFKNDLALSDEEVTMISAWANAGAPLGNVADMPSPIEFSDASEWSYGEPDVIIEWNYRVRATGSDEWGELYSQDLFDQMDKPRYIKAIQIRAVDDASRRVVHHAMSYTSQGSANPDNDQFLIDYASGKSAEIYPDNSGVLLNPDNLVRLSYHTHSIGEVVDAKIQMGIVFYPEDVVPEHRRWTKLLGYSGSLLDIPAGEIVRTDGYVYFHDNATITSFQPHMHGMGSYQCLELIYPSSGTSAQTEMISCTNWDYNWHTIYNYADDVAPLVPAGTVAHIISYFDNTDSNPGNMDARNWAGDGRRTIDEMAFAFLGWYAMTDEEYLAEMERRNALNRGLASSND
ncbi:MAG: hypothetical protein O2971_13360 [Proteobacteria bacterium]|nr:hypothetical protein [Pseudomonadota bacterium]